MSRSQIRLIKPLQAKAFKLKNNPKTQISEDSTNIEIFGINGTTQLIEDKEYSITTVNTIAPASQIKSKLPFRVRFTQIGPVEYGRNNPAPIGIAVIGFNNYIL